MDPPFGVGKNSLDFFDLPARILVSKPYAKQRIANVFKRIANVFRASAGAICSAYVQDGY
jgi:hypothetical protein